MHIRFKKDLDGRVKPGHDGEVCAVCTNKNGRVFRPGRFKLNPPMFR